MAQRMFHESGEDGRSVLGTLAVQVERDPKTGASVVRSVTPVSTPAGPPTATTVFDDGRMSIHTVGGEGGQPSTEELGQILSVIDGVGIKVLLDEEVTTNKAGTKTENQEVREIPEANVPSFSACHAMSEEDNTQFDSSRSYKAEPEIENYAVSVKNEEDQKVDSSITAVSDIVGGVDNVVDEKLVEGPVTLLFLGYTDDTTDQCHDPENHGGMLTAERVMITEEGEEHVLEPETSLPEREPPQEVFQEVPLEGNGAGIKVQREENEKVLHDASLPVKAEEEANSQRKTCQCCSVM